MHSLPPFVRALGIAVVVGPAVLAHQRIDRQMVRPSSGLTIEVEALAGSAKANQGQVGVQNMRGFGSGWSGGAQLFWGGAQIGARLRLSFPTTAPGRYEVFLHFTCAPDFAVVQARLDDAPPVTFDGFAPTVSRNRVSLGIRDLTPGPHELWLAVTAKDGKSSGFNVGLDLIELEARADRNRSVDPREMRRPDPGGIPAAATVPVLQIPAASTPRNEAPEQRSIEPLPMNARVEITQRALSSTSISPGLPGAPLRLSARITKRLQSSLHVRRGMLDSRNGRSIIALPVGGLLDLNYEPVVPARPHLLDCGTYATNAQVRLSARTAANTWVELSTFSFASSQDRLLAVVVPSQSRIELSLTMIKGTDFRVFYCELTPFK